MNTVSWFQIRCRGCGVEIDEWREGGPEAIKARWNKRATAAADAAPALPAGGAGLPTAEILALRVRNAVEGECGGFAVGYKESLEIAAYALTGLPPGPDRAAILARLAERRPAAGVEPAPGRVDAGAVRPFLTALDAWGAADHERNPDDLDDEEHAAELRRLWSAVVAQRAALDAALDWAGDGWRPIETAPKDGTYILVCRIGDDIGPKPMEIVEWCEFKRTDYEPAENGLFRRVITNERGFWNGNGHRATHWRPLPTPPSTSTGAAP